MITIKYQIISACLDGFSPFEVRIECYIGRGLPSFKIVGLPDASVREAMDRIYSAIRSSNFEIPISKVVINLSPSDIKKCGTHLDLPICLALLASESLSSGCLDQATLVDPKAVVACFGELSLYGEVVQTAGLIPLLLGLSQLGIEKFMVPLENLQECQAIQVGTIVGVRNIQEAISFLKGDLETLDSKEQIIEASLTKTHKATGDTKDYGDVWGCEEGKRVMEIAAAGRHHTLLMGAPGTGKTMLVSRLPGLLPEPTWDEILEITRIHNMAGLQRQGLMNERPFRNPHYTIAQAGFIGGYTRLVPGEVSLAHNGILFLDEVMEFKREVLESLRTLLDQRTLVLRRGKRYYEVPCDFLLMAAANPCPCGYFGSEKSCTCRQSERERYLAKISGPVADRIDLKLMMGQINHGDTSQSQVTTAQMKMRVEKAWAKQKQRNGAYGVLRNSDLHGQALLACCGLSRESQDFLRKTAQMLLLSKRSEEKILRVARTIADLDGKEHVDGAALREAILYNGNLERHKR